MVEIETIAELKRRVEKKQFDVISTEDMAMDEGTAYRSGYNDACDNIKKLISEFEASVRKLLEYIERLSIPPCPEKVLRWILGDDAETAGEEKNGD